MVTQRAGKVQAKGMWKDRKGLGSGSEHNQGRRDAVQADTIKQLGGLFAALREVETVIDQAGAVLNISQPNGMVGKFGVRWWSPSSHDIYREPTLVRWMKQPNGVMTPKVAKIAKAKRGGAFALNADETQQCLDILKGLIQRRAELKARIFTLRKSLHRLDGVSYYLNNERLRLEQIKQTVLGNLIEQGYEVEADYLDDEDA